MKMVQRFLSSLGGPAFCALFSVSEGKKRALGFRLVLLLCEEYPLIGKVLRRESWTVLQTTCSGNGSLPAAVEMSLFLFDVAEHLP